MHVQLLYPFTVAVLAGIILLCLLTGMILFQATLHAREALRTQYGIQSGGVGTPEAVRRPAIVATSLGDRQVRVAVFTIVA